MKFLLYSILLMSCNLIYGYNEDVEITTEVARYCRDRNKTIGGSKSELFNVVEAYLNEKVMLQCHFCNEPDDARPKIWYRMDRMDDAKLFEVKLDGENNMTLNRVHTNVDHTLVIHNVTEEDGGEYFCKALDDQDSTYKYNYFLDIVFPTDVLPEKGNLTLWRKYHDDLFVPINRLFPKGMGLDQVYFRDQMRIDLQLMTQWESPGNCEICGRPKGEGKRETIGHCRLKIRQNANVTVVARNYYEKVLLRASHISCRSLTLKFVAPTIFNRTQQIPSFIDIEKCDGICNPDAEGVYRGWKSTKKTGFKYRKTFVLAENAHLTIICPESTLENVVVWRINGHRIRPGESVEPPDPKIEPRVTVDTFNTLYLYGVTKDEEGNYTCHVDDIRMQLVRVFVVSKSKLLTQAFVRHMMYLAFVLSLTLSCYCAGLFITWTRRDKFKTYREVRKEAKKKNQIFLDDDEEKSLLDESTTMEDSTLADVSTMPTSERSGGHRSLTEEESKRRKKFRDSIIQNRDIG